MSNNALYQVKEMQNIVQSEIAFFDRRMFRISYAYSVEAGVPQTIKFSSPVNFILRSQVVAATSNGILYEAVVGGTPSGSFSQSITTWGVNRMNEVDQAAYLSQVSISTGGSVSGGAIAETISIASSNQSPNITDTITQPRGLPAGDYYLRLTSLGGNAVGTIALVWEERP